MRNDYHQPDLDGSEPDEPDYLSAGLPDAALMAQWVAKTLARRRPGALSALAHAAVNEFEAAPAGSAREATLQLLSDALHEALINDDEPEPEPCDICGAVGLDFTLYVDAAGVGHNVCAACDAEPDECPEGLARIPGRAWVD